MRRRKNRRWRSPHLSHSISSVRKRAWLLLQSFCTADIIASFLPVPNHKRVISPRFFRIWNRFSNRLLDNRFLHQYLKSISLCQLVRFLRLTAPKVSATDREATQTSSVRKVRASWTSFTSSLLIIWDSTRNLDSRGSFRMDVEEEFERMCKTCQRKRSPPCTWGATLRMDSSNRRTKENTESVGRMRIFTNDIWESKTPLLSFSLHRMKLSRSTFHLLAQRKYTSSFARKLPRLTSLKSNSILNQVFEDLLRTFPRNSNVASRSLRLWKIEVKRSLLRM